MPRHSTSLRRGGGPSPSKDRPRPAWYEHEYETTPASPHAPAASATRRRDLAHRPPPVQAWGAPASARHPPGGLEVPGQVDGRPTRSEDADGRGAIVHFQTV